MTNQAASRARAFVISSWLGCGYAAAFSLINVLRGEPFLLALNVGVLVAALTNLAAYRRTGNTTVAGAVGLSILMAFALLATGPLGLAAVVWIYVVPIPAFHFLGTGAARKFLGAWGTLVVGWLTVGPMANSLTRSAQIEVLASFGLVCFLSDRIEVLRDATTRRINHLADEAQQANRAKNRFLSQMSHELRTPLNAILGFAQILEARPDLPPALRPHVQHINTSGTALLELIGTFLDFSLLDTGEISKRPQRFPLRVMLDEAVAVAELLTGDRRVNHASDDVAGCEVLGDRKLLKQAMLALLTDAVRATPAGKQVHLRCDVGTTIDLVVSWPADPSAAQDASRDQSTRVIVRRIAELHDGTLTCTAPSPGQQEAILSLPASAVAEAVPLLHH